MDQPLAPAEVIAARGVGGTGWHGVRRRYAAFREEIPMAVAFSSILDIALGGFSIEYIFQDDRTGCKRIFKYAKGWLYTTFLVLLDMRATVPY